MSAKKTTPLISPQEWKWFWIISLSLALVSGVVTGLAEWLGRPEEPQNVLPAQSPFKKDVADTIPKKILLTDFDLPAEGGSWLAQGWLYSRAGGSRPWSEEEMAPFWTPNSQLPLLQLPARNAQAIEDLFGSVR